MTIGVRMKENIVKQKAKEFAIRIVRLSKFLKEEKKEFDLSKQILHSGTSIGANIYEAEHAQSREDFIHKLSISLKEANETEYWLELLNATDYVSNEQYDSLRADCSTICKLLITIIKKLKIENK